jgi:hypothetical protein
MGFAAVSYYFSLLSDRFGCVKASELMMPSYASAVMNIQSVNEIDRITSDGMGALCPKRELS